MWSCFREVKRRSCPRPLALFALLTDVDPASIEPLHGDAESLPFSSQPVAHRNDAVLKDHSPSWLGIPAYLGKNRAPSRLPEEQHNSDTEPPACSQPLCLTAKLPQSTHGLCGLASKWNLE